MIKNPSILYGTIALETTVSQLILGRDSDSDSYFRLWKTFCSTIRDILASVFMYFYIGHVIGWQFPMINKFREIRRWFQWFFSYFFISVHLLIFLPKMILRYKSNCTLSCILDGSAWPSILIFSFPNIESIMFVAG